VIIIFICVANSARSQMAEGLTRQSAPPGVEVYSAGSKPGTLNPYAVRVLRELDIDIAHHRPKGFDNVPIAMADFIITLCAEEECPYVASAARRLSWAMPDPAAGAGDEQAKLAAFRTTRDDILGRLQEFWSVNTGMPT